MNVTFFENLVAKQQIIRVDFGFLAKAFQAMFHFLFEVTFFVKQLIEVIKLAIAKLSIKRRELSCTVTNIQTFLGQLSLSVTSQNYKWNSKDIFGVWVTDHPITTRLINH